MSNTYVPVVPYADVEFATDYVADAKIPAEVTAWVALSGDQQLQLLRVATQMIDLLPLSGTRNGTEYTQPRSFPRNGWLDIPLDVSLCCCEIAFELAAGRTLRTLQKDIGKVAETIGDATTQWSAGGATALLDANYGMVSAMAARFLSPYLRDYDVIDLERVG